LHNFIVYSHKFKIIIGINYVCVEYCLDCVFNVYYVPTNYLIYYLLVLLNGDIYFVLFYIITLHYSIYWGDIINSIEPEWIFHRFACLVYGKCKTLLFLMNIIIYCVFYVIGVGKKYYIFYIISSSSNSEHCF